MATAVICSARRPISLFSANGSLSPVHAGGTIDGFEARVKNTLLYGYYGGIYIGRDVAIDANGNASSGTATQAPPTARTARSTKSPSGSIRPSGGIRGTAPST